MIVFFLMDANILEQTMIKMYRKYDFGNKEILNTETLPNKQAIKKLHFYLLRRKPALGVVKC